MLTSSADDGRACVVHIINSLGTGGAERQLIGLARATQGKGARNIIVPLVVRPNAIPNLDVEVVTPGGTGILGVIRAIRKLISIARTERRVVLVAWMYHSWLAALIVNAFTLNATRVIFYCRHGDVATLSKKTRCLTRFLLWVAKRRHVPVVFNSVSARTSHRSLVVGYESCVIPNSWEFLREHRKRETSTIGFLGRNHSDKGADQLVSIVPRILRELDGWSARLAGPGIDLLEPLIRRELERVGLSPDLVKVEGAIGEVNDFFSGVDVLLLPSRTESFPNVVVEAISHGVVPVCMDVGDAEYILDGHMKVASTIDSLVELAIRTCRLESLKRAGIAQRLSQSVRTRFAMSRVEGMHMKVWLRGEME